MKYMTIFFAFSAFLFLGGSQHSKSVKLDYSNEGITDDPMAKAIKFTKPLSITQDILDKMIERINASYLDKNYRFQDVTELDFSNNFLTSVGALEIVKFLLENRGQFKNLKMLKLSFNRISEDDSYDSFVQSLLNFITNFSCTKVDLTGNYLSPERLWRDSRLKFLENEYTEISLPQIIYKTDAYGK